MEKPSNSKWKAAEVQMLKGFALVNEDILQSILSRLPALSFASAACVSKTWNSVCKCVLSRPKVASALSINTSLQGAVREVLDKVLSNPIRPHFAFACIGINFSLDVAHKLIKKRLGPGIPIITLQARGIIGTDAINNELREVKWTDVGGNLSAETHNLPDNISRGITLMIGFLPGLKVEAIPLLRSMKVPYESIIDKFVMDITDYTTSISGSTSPDAILLFGDQYTDMRRVLHKLDNAMPLETPIVGDVGGCFLYESTNSCRFLNENLKHYCDAVALIFARARKKPRGLGETHFHAMLSTGLSPVGSTYKAVSVRERGELSEYSTWLTAKKDGVLEVFDGERMLSDIDAELENGIEGRELYIGVTKRRKCYVWSENPRLATSLEFHEVLGGDEAFLEVDGVGIKTGDLFRFYHSDPTIALSSCAIVSENLRNLKQLGGGVDSQDKKEVFGGIIFACYGRGDSFFERRNVDSSPLMENFPGIPMTGLFCAGEIGRGSSCFFGEEGQGPSSLRRYMHVYSTVYLVMSYTPSLQGR